MRETWAAPHEFDAYAPSEIPEGTPVHYAATAKLGGPSGLGGLRVRPSIFMPRWASRILLEITDVRLEWLQEITPSDAIAEGIEQVGDEYSRSPWRNYSLKPGAPAVLHSPSPSHSFMTLFESINGPGSWAANPRVWVIGFRLLTALGVTP